MFKFLYKVFVFPFTKEGLEIQRKQMLEAKCRHEEWDMDNQIRTIKCRECGKKAWVREYKNLYKGLF